jgi:hypothetical protein
MSRPFLYLLAIIEDRNDIRIGIDGNNNERPQQALGYLTPARVFNSIHVGDIGAVTLESLTPDT